MRFPFSLTRALSTYLLRKRIARQAKFPLVLMLEPLHACNLHCAGCGRIREYADTLNRRMSVAECVQSVEECGAPVVSICGGEPLIYPEIGDLCREILDRGRHIYLCTNGTALEQKLPVLPDHPRLFINVHLDGMEASHDAMAGRQGVFSDAVQGIQAAKAAGRRVYTNTTIYRETDVDELAVLFGYLTELGVDGMMIAPAYGYQAVEAEGAGASSIFMSREEIEAKFRLAREKLRWFKVTATPIYFDFLCGQRHLPCAAWASPTRNVRGWKAPCYLITDSHEPTYQDLLDHTDWERLGPGRDPRCAQCMMHCGFEPAAVLSGNWGWRDALRMAVWQMS